MGVLLIPGVSHRPIQIPMTIRQLLALLLFCQSAGLWSQQIDQNLTEIPQQRPLHVAGSLWMQSGFYDVRGIPARTNNFIWSMGVQATATVYGIAIPFAFTVGQFGNQFSRPTFGQVGVSPRYKWATAHLGHRNLSFSPYTLAGHTFLGAGVELQPGRFRFAAMYGRFRNAEAEQPNLIAILPTFQRTGYGMKVGVGSATNFVDLIVFKGRDGIRSLPDTLPAVRPAENLVLGLSSRIQIAGPLGYYLDIAGSAFTRDLQSRIFSGDSLSVDQYIPESLFTPRYSSRVNFAGKTGLRFTLPRFQLGVEYERIDPEYESMGAFFFMNDLEQITISPAFRLWKDRIGIQGSGGMQRNNLLGNRSESTRRFIANGNLTYARPGSPFGLGLTYSNFSINQTDGRLELSDTIRLTMVTQNLQLSPYWNWADTLMARSLFLTASYQALNDRNPFTREFTDMNTLFFTAMYSWTRLATGLGLSLGVNYNRIGVFSLDTRRYGLSAGVNQSIARGRGHAGLQGTWNRSTINAKADGSNWTMNLHAGWSPARTWNMSLYTNILGNTSRQFENYTEFLGGLRVQWLFGQERGWGQSRYGRANFAI